MSLTRDVGIILKNTDSGEADIISTVLCKNIGRINVRFRGLRKTKRRSISGIDPSSIISFEYRDLPQNNIVTVSNYETLHHPEKIRSDLDVFYATNFLLETINLTTAEHDPQPELFTLLEGALNLIETSTPNLRILVIFFLVRICKLHGLLSSPASCSSCGKTSLELFSDSGLNVLLCSDCMRPGHRIHSQTVIHELNLMQQTRFSKYNCLLEQDEMQDMYLILLHTLENNFHVVFRCGKLIFDK